jgi:hypothetical protein
MIQFNKEGIEILDELLPLLHDHAREVNWIDQPIDPNRELYERLLKSGQYVLFTARSLGKLIGYAGFFVNEHPHYRGFRQAVSDVIYISPSHRYGVGAWLITFAETSLDVNSILFYVTVQKDYSKTLEDRGYRLIEHTYAKRM